MAGKKLFTGDLASATDTYFGPVPASLSWSFTASFCNRTSSPVTVRLGVCATNSVAAGEHYEYEATIQPYGVLERTGLVADAGKYIYARASAAGVSFNGHGYEE